MLQERQQGRPWGYLEPCWAGSARPRSQNSFDGHPKTLKRLARGGGIGLVLRKMLLPKKIEKYRKTNCFVVFSIVFCILLVHFGKNVVYLKSGWQGAKETLCISNLVSGRSENL